MLLTNQGGRYESSKLMTNTKVVSLDSDINVLKLSKKILKNEPKIIKKYPPRGFNGLITDGNTGLGYYDPANGWTHSSGTIPINEWVHVAMSIQTGSNNLKFYKKGQLMSSHTLSNTSTTATGVMNIGRQSPASCTCNV